MTAKVLTGIALRALIVSRLVHTAVAAEDSVTLRAADVWSLAPPGSVQIAGRLGRVLDECIQNRVLHQPIEPLVRPYREKQETGTRDWRCEYWGKWFTSLALADAYRSSTATRVKLREAVEALLATADEDGYLGTRSREHRLEGWDVWGRKYALLGLLAAYERTGDRNILAAARRHLDTLLSETGPGRRSLVDTDQVHKGLASSSVLEPVVLTYRYTGERRYLDYALYIVRSWSEPSEAFPDKGLQLIEEILAGTPPSQMRWHKAYEQMSCLEGLCELYRVTGEPKYRDAAVRFGEAVLRHEVTIVGPGAQHEHWYGGRTNQSGYATRPVTQCGAPKDGRCLLSTSWGALHLPQETCVTVTWMKYLVQLLRLTGDVQWADELEKNLFNALLAAQMPGGHWWAYFTPLNGERVPSLVQHRDVELSCCVVSGPRGLLLTPRWAFMTASNGLVINLYGPMSARLPAPSGQTVEVRQQTDYPVEGKVRLSVRMRQPEHMTLYLRIPHWSETTRCVVAGHSVEVRRGTYAKLDRTWNDGDTVQLEFDMRGRILWEPPNQVAIARGPLVLSMDDRLVKPATRPYPVALDISRKPWIELRPNPDAARRIGAWVAMDVPMVHQGVGVWLPTTGTVWVTFCDYATAGNQYNSNNRFRTWFPQPLWLGEIFEPGQTWVTLTQHHYRPEPPEWARPRRRWWAVWE